MEQSSRLTEMAAGQIKAHHPHLTEATIEWWFVDGKADPIVVVDKLKAVVRAATGIDFVVSVKEDLWNEMEVDEQERLVDNTLASMGFRDNVPYKQKPDVQFFSDVAKRRGVAPEIKAIFDQLDLPLAAA